MVSFSQTGLQNMFQNMPPEHATRTCHQNTIEGSEMSLCLDFWNFAMGTVI